MPTASGVNWLIGAGGNTLYGTGRLTLQGSGSGTAASVVVYWNFYSPVCGAQTGGSLAQFQAGAIFRSAYSTSDFTLIQLDDAVDPSFNLSYAGWERGSAAPTSAVAIHHPNCDEKSISFENDATTTTAYLSNTVVAGGSHIRVIDWDLGTTEPGSSGSRTARRGTVP